MLLTHSSSSTSYILPDYILLTRGAGASFTVSVRVLPSAERVGTAGIHFAGLDWLWGTSSVVHNSSKPLHASSVTPLAHVGQTAEEPLLGSAGSDVDPNMRASGVAVGVLAAFLFVLLFLFLLFLICSTESVGLSGMSNPSRYYTTCLFDSVFRLAFEIPGLA